MDLKWYNKKMDSLLALLLAPFVAYVIYIYSCKTWLGITSAGCFIGALRYLPRDKHNKHNCGKAIESIATGAILSLGLQCLFEMHQGFRLYPSYYSWRLKKECCSHNRNKYSRIMLWTALLLPQAITCIRLLGRPAASLLENICQTRKTCQSPNRGKQFYWAFEVVNIFCPSWIGFWSIPDLIYTLVCSVSHSWLVSHVLNHNPGLQPIIVGSLCKSSPSQANHILV